MFPALAVVPHPETNALTPVWERGFNPSREGAAFQARRDPAGRSSDFQARHNRWHLLDAASQDNLSQCVFPDLPTRARRSFLITAAGQFRTYTGFPFNA